MQISPRVEAIRFFSKLEDLYHTYSHSFEGIQFCLRGFLIIILY